MSSSTQSGIKLVLDKLEAAGCLVTFSSVMVMVFLGHGKLEFNFKSLARWMAYLDAIAFVIYITGEVVDQTMSTCQFAIFSLFGDLFVRGANTYTLLGYFAPLTRAVHFLRLQWALKDATRLGYLIHRGLVVHDWHQPHVVILVMVLEFAFYCGYMSQVYSFTGNCTFQWDATKGATAALFVYFLVVELVSGALVITKLRMILAELNQSPAHGGAPGFQSQLNKYRRVFRYQEARVLICIAGMLYQVILVLINMFSPITVPSARNLVFTFSQQLLLVSSFGSSSSAKGRASSVSKSSEPYAAVGSATAGRKVSGKPPAPES